MISSLETVRSQFTELGQEHIFTYWDELDDNGRATLLADCEAIDQAWLAARLASLPASSSTVAMKAFTGTRPEPAPVIRLPITPEEHAAEAAAKEIGEAALRAGRVAAFLVAGGQGTRLGFAGPKGCYELGPLSGKTLFAWHAEQILASARRYNCTIPWYIMTSRANHEETLRYFEENDFLGFAREDVKLFPQAMVPSLTKKGKLILVAADRLAMNPDGHGGALRALVSSGACEDMQKRGVDTLSYFQVDNPLVTICDPTFIGYHQQAEAEMSSKILKKSGPEEKVGNLCLLDGKTTVIEYSDMRNEDATARDKNGELKFWAGSIAIHLLNVAFVTRIGSSASLPWHLAKKRIPYYKNGQMVTPEITNGIKFETFVFDALPLTQTSVTLEVDRAREFAPVKNATGVDSAASCRQLLTEYFAKWFEAAGQTIPRDATGAVTIPLEVSPLFALDAATLAAKLPADFTVGKQVLLG